jgi:hypothetical protein
MRYVPAVIFAFVVMLILSFKADAGLFKKRASACAPAATSCAGAAACAGAVQVAPAPAPAAPAACAGAKSTGCAGATGCSGTQRAPRQRLFFRAKSGC